MVFGTDINSYFFPGLATDLAAGEQSYLVVNSDGSLAAVKGTVVAPAAVAPTQTAAASSAPAPASAPAAAAPAATTEVAASAPVTTPVETAANATVEVAAAATASEQTAATTEVATNEPAAGKGQLSPDLMASNAAPDMPEMIVENEPHNDAKVEMAENEAQNSSEPELQIASGSGDNAVAPAAMVNAEPTEDNGLTRGNLNQVPGTAVVAAPVPTPQPPARQAAEVGTGNSATGTGSFAAGNMSVANGTSAIALGNAATAIGNGAMAIGNGASASAAGAVAIGPNAVATRPNQISVGTSSATYTLAGIGSSASLAAQQGALKLVTADPLGNLGTTSLDIGTLQGLNGRVSGLESTTAALADSISFNYRHNNGGIAAAMAMSGTIIVPDSNWSLSANVSTYEGEQGFSAGLVGRVTEKVYISGSIGGSTVRGTTGGRVGVAVGF